MIEETISTSSERPAKHPVFVVTYRMFSFKSRDTIITITCFFKDFSIAPRRLIEPE